jgi:hypothetical protein
MEPEGSPLDTFLSQSNEADTLTLYLFNPLNTKVNTKNMSGKCQAILLKNAGSHKNNNKSETITYTNLKCLQDLTNKFLCFHN